MLFFGSAILLVTLTQGYAYFPTGVKWYTNRSIPFYDRICNNKTKGIYNPDRPGSVDGNKCCKGKFLVEPFSILLDDTQHDDQIHLPDHAYCDYNLTSKNETDNIGTLMWKIHACQIKSFLRGKSENEIDFKTYVEIRTVNYSTANNGHNLQKLIREGITECSDADKETIFHKKIAKYFWCFHKNEQNICEEPTAQSQETLTSYLNLTNIINKKANVTCPLVPPGTSLREHCCNGVSTPYSWVRKFHTMTYVRPPILKLANGTYAGTQSYADCLRTSFNLKLNLTVNSKPPNQTDAQRKYKRGFSYHSLECQTACSINPVSFLDDGSSTPSVKFDVDKAIDQHLASFNTATKTAVRKMAIKIWHLEIERMNKQIPDKTKVKFEEADDVFKKLTTPAKKVRMYCSYYTDLDLTIARSSSAICEAWKTGIDK